jgi:NH3-dependent NAD+ synthetase
VIVGLSGGIDSSYMGKGFVKYVAKTTTLQGLGNSQKQFERLDLGQSKLAYLHGQADRN